MRDTRALYRSDFFPGLGWMLRSELWQEIKCAARPARLPALPALPTWSPAAYTPFWACGSSPVDGLSVSARRSAMLQLVVELCCMLWV